VQWLCLHTYGCFEPVFPSIEEKVGKHEGAHSREAAGVQAIV